MLTAPHPPYKPILAALLLTTACTTASESSFVHLQLDDVESGGIQFQRLALTEGIIGPAFASIADFSENGRIDIALSLFGKVDGFQIPDGEVRLFEQGEDWTQWTSRTILTTELASSPRLV